MDKFTNHTRLWRRCGAAMSTTRLGIIPAVRSKRITCTGFEDGLFAAWRKTPSSCSISRHEKVQRGRARFRHRLLA